MGLVTYPAVLSFLSSVSYSLLFTLRLLSLFVFNSPLNLSGIASLSISYPLLSSSDRSPSTLPLLYRGRALFLDYFSASSLGRSHHVFLHELSFTARGHSSIAAPFTVFVAYYIPSVFSAAHSFIATTSETIAVHTILTQTLQVLRPYRGRFIHHEHFSFRLGHL